MAKFHDDALVTELKLLRNISSPFVSDTFESALDVSRALISALRGIYRRSARLLRLYLFESMSVKCWSRAIVFVPSTAEELVDKQTYQEHLNHRTLFCAFTNNCGHDRNKLRSNNTNNAVMLVL